MKKHRTPRKAPARTPGRRERGGGNKRRFM